MKYLFLGLLSFSIFAEEYKPKTIKASNLAKDFFGTPSMKEKKSSKVNFGSIGASFETNIKCGRIDVVGSVTDELKDIENQAKKMVTQIIGQFTNVGGLAMGLVCYYKPTVCSYIRDSKFDFKHALQLELDGCQAIDSYIAGQADKGSKSNFAKEFGKCIGDNPTTARIRNCKRNSTAKARNLANPASDILVARSQDVLKSILRAAKSSSNYDLLVPLLGEIRLNHSGYWYRAFPTKLLRPTDLVTDFIDEGVLASCKTQKLKQALRIKWNKAPSNLKDYIKYAIKDHMAIEDINDLDGLPNVDKQLACDSLGKSIAQEAINKMATDMPAVLSVAIQNDALPKDIRELLIKKSETTFKALNLAVKNKKIGPLKLTLKNIRKLAYSHRKSRRKEASEISGKRLFNRSSILGCVDELTCGINR